MEVNIQQLIERADAGDQAAQERLALCYLRGEGVPANRAKALEVLRKYAGQDNDDWIEAQLNAMEMADDLTAGSILPSQIDELKERIEEYNDIDAMITLADALNTKYASLYALALYLSAAKLGSAEGQYKYAMCCWDTPSWFNGDDAEPAGFLLQSAEHGYVESQYEIANCYAMGLGVEKDVNKAVYWYTKAAKQRHIYAKRELIENYKYMLQIGNKKYSDQQLSESYLAAIEKRKTWCKQKAQEYVAQKQPQVQYVITVYEPDVEFTIDAILNPQEEQELRTFVEQMQQEFQQQFPDEANDKKAWHEYLYNAFFDSDITITIDNGFGISQNAQVRFIDFEQPHHCFVFDVRDFANVNDAGKVSKALVNLTDEQYATILAEFVEDENMTMDLIYQLHPEIREQIFEQVHQAGYEVVVFPREILSDRDAILAQHGSDMPPMPQGTFAGIAAYNASKNI